MPPRPALRAAPPRLPACLVGVCTVPLAAFAFMLASGYAALGQIFQKSTVDALYIALQVGGRPCWPVRCARCTISAAARGRAIFCCFG